MAQFSVTDVEADFRNAAERRGVLIKSLHADGRLHRCDAIGKGGKGDAAYLLHTDGLPAGGFENHRDGLGWETWRANVQTVMTAEERAAYRATIERECRKRELAKALLLKQALAKAAWILQQSTRARPDHPYLVRKQVQPHGLREYRGMLVVPMRALGGKLTSLQFIGPDGTKQFLKGGVTEGSLYEIGKASGSHSMAIAEGFATAASIHEATGIPVAVAFNARNLLLVARAVRTKYPAAQLALCADDDWKTVNPVTGAPVNPGIDAACAAANTVSAALAVPVFGEGRRDSDTDFNDLAAIAGLDTVRAQVEHALMLAAGEVQQCA